MTLGSLWGYFAVTLDHFGVNSGSLWITLAPLWGHFRVTLDHFGVTLGSLWISLGSLSDHFRVTVGSLWGHIGVTWGLLWGTLRDLLVWGSFGRHLAIIWDQLALACRGGGWAASGKSLASRGPVGVKMACK